MSSSKSDGRSKQINKMPIVPYFYRNTYKGNYSYLHGGNSSSKMICADILRGK